MNQTGRGYSMPLVVNRGKRFFAAATLLIAIVIVNVVPVIMETSEKTLQKIIVMNFIFPLFSMFIFWEAAECFAKLHFVPEGIAITLGKWTIRRVPVEQIRLLCGVRHKYKADITDLIAVCPMTMEEMADLMERKTPGMLRNSRTIPNWAEEMSAKNVNRRSTMFRRRMPGILWIEWSPERLRKLQNMYPHAHWLDCTANKMFDSQLTN